MDPWLNEFERLNQLASEISADIKDVRGNASGAAQAKQNAMVRRKLVQLTTDIANLHDALPRLQITDKERQRRKDLLYGMSTRKDQLSDTLTKSSNPSLSAQLQQSPEAGRKRAWGAQPQETEETKDLNNAQLLHYQKTVMQQQDDHIDILSASIVRQKEIAVTINTELDVHTRLLDDLDSKTDKTAYGIQAANKRISRVAENSKVGGMWCVIILLIIFIIVLAATDWGCDIHKFKNCSNHVNGTDYFFN
eukprot:Phypoly_transcript_14212.p1 GENE.Phypoly_transcript_14212~~Phypoly_transcript_14212.p1  ORF type:complete len:250 (+),score=47.31 Phypoly_transcript_14212:106-855(+)